MYRGTGVFDYRAIREPDLPARASCKRCVMRHDYNCRAGLPVQLLEQCNNSLATRGIEIACWLVSEQDRRTIGECTRDRDTLLFATGELHREVCSALAEPDALEQVGRTSLGTGLTSEFQRNLNVLGGRECRDELKTLEDEPYFRRSHSRTVILAQAGHLGTIQDHAASARCIETREQTQQRSFTAA